MSRTVSGFQRFRPWYAAIGGAADPISILGSKLLAWYDPSDLTTLFQDSAGTTPVTADGDPVGLMRDKSGNGWHASQSVSADRMIYRTAGGLHWLTGNGVSQHLVIANTMTGALSSNNTVVFGGQSNANTVYFWGGTNDGGINALTSPTNTFRPAVKTGAAVIVGNGTTVLSTPRVMTYVWDRTAGNVKGFVNRALEVNASGTPADKTAAVTFSLGARGAGTPFLNGSLYNTVFTADLLTASETERLEDFVAEKTGVAL